MSDDAQPANQILSAVLTGQTKTVELYPSSEDEDANGKADALSHRDAMTKFNDGLAELIVGDPLLSDLPSRATVEELQAQLALHHGQAMSVIVQRHDSISMPVVVEQQATVHDLKLAIKRHVSLQMERNNTGQTKNISWRYIWRTYWLCFETQRLTDDKKPLKEYGVFNKATVKFVKRMKER